MTDPASPDPARTRDVDVDPEAEDVSDQEAELDPDDPLDDGPDDGPDDEPEPLRPAAVVAVVALAAAAALSVFAPFRSVYTASFDVKKTDQNPAGTYELVADGWGRFNSGVVNPASHGIRFGIALVVCAAVLLMLAATVAAATIDPERWRPRLGAVTAAAAAVTAGVAGVLGSILLSVDSRADEFTRAYSDAATVSTTPGWCAWTLCAVIVLGIVAVAGLHRLRSEPAAAPVDEHRSTDDEPMDVLQ